MLVPDDIDTYRCSLASLRDSAGKDSAPGIARLASPSHALLLPSTPVRGKSTMLALAARAETVESTMWNDQLPGAGADPCATIDKARLSELGMQCDPADQPER